MRVRKKPVEIQAWLTSDILYAMEHDWKALPKEVAAAYEDAVLVAPTRKQITIKTLEGDMISLATDYLMLGVQGEFYPCKPDIFDATYDILENA